ncbi:BnaCnng46830D [Brassica napus]|uniref:BnaCnng46830D protein n=1 Tax=Brassica napus TaxID=3708 RepID=A0A078JJ57_BRANA|nr:BnaCnng46830D [Brassica napus]
MVAEIDAFKNGGFGWKLFLQDRVLDSQSFKYFQTLMSSSLPCIQGWV